MATNTLVLAPRVVLDPGFVLTPVGGTVDPRDEQVRAYLQTALSAEDGTWTKSSAASSPAGFSFDVWGCKFAFPAGTCITSITSVTCEYLTQRHPLADLLDAQTGGGQEIFRSDAIYAYTNFVPATTGNPRLAVQSEALRRATAPLSSDGGAGGRRQARPTTAAGTGVTLGNIDSTDPARDSFTISNIATAADLAAMYLFIDANSDVEYDYIRLRVVYEDCTAASGTAVCTPATAIGTTSAVLSGTITGAGTGVIRYGTQSGGPYPSSAPFGVVTGLTPNTRYYFVADVV